MRFYSNVGCYHGRKPEQMERKLAGLVQRQPSKQPDGKPAKAAQKGGIGDVSDPWLRGRSGELYEYFDKRKPRR